MGRLTRESQGAQSPGPNRPRSSPCLRGSYTRFLREMMKETAQGWMNQLDKKKVKLEMTCPRTSDPKCTNLRANKGRAAFLLGVLLIPTARRATAPRRGVPACVEGVPARKSGSAMGGAWLIDWPPCGVGVCGSSSSIAIATSSSEEGIGSGDEDMLEVQSQKLARPTRSSRWQFCDTTRLQR